ncbi:SRPBCC family protein [Nocardia sp. CDC153]|uniref:type II toxin-antitoxin system RatA family toxin n=1 Tax=Nocardia sp. CDC153 TaxID=3112167 RepID=UPI002DBA775B|nr:SRPBCC family protein [Nocardia sp. CDC153]MEC3956860.1 SRPBCC family protein [Nocardia sp. CDC153]
MRTVTLSFVCPGIDPVAAFDRISDFESYPNLTDAVVAVEIQPGEGVGVVSSWTVKFRKGLLRWTEHDVLDREAGEIEFRQLEGDFEIFDGAWRVRPAQAGSEVVFDARFDLGIPSLAELLDPVAEAALSDNIALILAGLFGEIRQVAPMVRS